MVLSFFFVMPAITLSALCRTGQQHALGSAMGQQRQSPSSFPSVIIRGVYLKSVGLDALWPHVLAMAVLGIILLAVSLLRFRKSLE